MTMFGQASGFEARLDSLRKYGDHSSAFLSLNSGNEYFTVEGVDGFIAYRASGRFLIQFGGVLAAPEDQEGLLRGFLEFARGARRRVVSVQLRRADAEFYAERGFTVNQMGSSYSVRLPEFTLRGSRFVKLRNKISRARRSGLDVAETPFAVCEEGLSAIDRQWLRGKGRHVKEIEFLVGECGGPAQDHRRLFLARAAGVPVAYVSYAPVYGSRAGWLHDLSRRTPGVTPGAMEAVNAHAMETFRREGAPWLHFGFTPFTGLASSNEVASASPTAGRLMRLLASHGDAVYPAASQSAYKEKWAPQLVLPEYLAFHGRARLGAVWQILRATRSI